MSYQIIQGRYLTGEICEPHTIRCMSAISTLNVIGSRDASGTLTLRHLHAVECKQWGKHDPTGKTPCACDATVFHAGPGAVPDVEAFLQRLREVTGVEPQPFDERWDDEEKI